MEKNLIDASSNAHLKSNKFKHKTRPSKSPFQPNNAADVGLLGSRTRHHASTLLLQVIAKRTKKKHHQNASNHPWKLRERPCCSLAALQCGSYPKIRSAVIDHFIKEPIAKYTKPNAPQG